VLEQTGQAENTIIIFGSDNGLAVGQHGLLGKQNLYEHSVRVPLVFAGPGIEGGRKTGAFCYLHDIFPTVCELLNLQVPDSVQSKSLLPILSKKSEEVRDSLYYGYKDFQRGLTKGRWKLIEYNVKGERRRQLFDLKEDPWEMNNLADKAESRAKLSEMRALMKEYKKKAADPVGWI
jgi:arylsulfatase A-like enzyme